MATTNELILDAGVRHQLRLQGFSRGMANRLIKILRSADVKIVRLLQGRGDALNESVNSRNFRRLMRDIQEIQQQAFEEFEETMRDELEDLVDFEADWQVDMMRRFAPDEATAQAIEEPDDKTLAAILVAGPILGVLLKDWIGDLGTNNFKAIQQALQLAAAEGLTMEEAIKRLEGTRTLNRRDGVNTRNARRAEVVTRTVVNGVADAASDAAYVANAALIFGVQWVATLDTSTCPTCMGLDGQIFPPGSGPRPPIHGSCRCTTIPVFGRNPASRMRYGEWLRGQSVAIQNEALGPTRAKLFRDGGLDIDAFTDSRGNTLTIDDLRAREAEAFRQAGV